MLLDARIYTFITACKHMNLTKAAKELCVTQPTVTQHIQQLESAFHTKLLQYSSRKLILTEAGRELLRAALTISNDELLLKERIKQAAGAPKSLAFGATMTIGEFVIGKKLDGLLAQHPDWNIHLTVGNTQQLLSLIDQGALEFAVVEGYFPKTEYDYQIFDTVPFIAVCQAGHPIARQTRQIEELFQERLLVREEGSGTRSILVQHLAQRNYEISDFRCRTEINQLSVLKNLVESGKGISFLYQTAVEDELRAGKLEQITIRDFQVRHQFTFVWRKGSIYQEEYQSIFRAFC